MTTETKILNELKAIKLDLDYIKNHMVDVDTILTPDEEERLNESLTDLKKGKATSLEEFEKEMENA
jgi:uncharacterized membrane protein YgcG